MLEIDKNLISYNQKLGRRSLHDVYTLVLHCTELPDEQMAREYAEKIHYDSGTGNCGHFYITKRGDVSQWVDCDRIAHHVANHNDKTLGIELENLGRFPYWLRTNYQIMYDPYPQVQIEALCQLIDYLQELLPSLRHIVGHEDLDRRLIPSENDPTVFVRRKVDPGIMFPWKTVLQHTNLEYSGNYGKPYESS